MTTQEQESNIILEAIDEFMFTTKKIEAKIKECDNTDIILLSEFAGSLVTYIKQGIQTKNISIYEKDKLNRQFNEAQDYFADAQIRFDLECSCKKISKEEKNAKRKEHAEKIGKMYGEKGVTKMIEIAKGQLAEQDILRRNK